MSRSSRSLFCAHWSTPSSIVSLAIRRYTVTTLSVKCSRINYRIKYLKFQVSSTSWVNQVEQLKDQLQGAKKKRSRQLSAIEVLPLRLAWFFPNESTTLSSEWLMKNNKTDQKLRFIVSPYRKFKILKTNANKIYENKQREIIFWAWI